MTWGATGTAGGWIDAFEACAYGQYEQIFEDVVHCTFNMFGRSIIVWPGLSVEVGKFICDAEVQVQVEEPVYTNKDAQGKVEPRPFCDWH